MYRVEGPGNHLTHCETLGEACDAVRAQSGAFNALLRSSDTSWLCCNNLEDGGVLARIYLETTRESPSLAAEGQGLSLDAQTPSAETREVGAPASRERMTPAAEAVQTTSAHVAMKK